MAALAWLVAAALPAAASGDFLPIPCNQTVFQGLKDHATWYAGIYELAKEHPKPVAPALTSGGVTFAALRRDLDFVGLGLCPGNRPIRRSFGVDAAKSCLQSCVEEPLCQVVSFSKRRGECLLGQKPCGTADLKLYAGYATFVFRRRLQKPVDIIDSYDVAIEADPLAAQKEPPVPLYVIGSESYAVFIEEFIAGLQLAGDATTLRIFNSSAELSVKHAFKEQSEKERPDAVVWFHDNMWRRDKEKWDLVMRAVWENVGKGEQLAVFSDLDIQLYPGWTELLRGCTAAADFCLGQSNGYYIIRTRPVNSGFIAIRTTEATLHLVMEFTAEYERQWTSIREKWNGFLEQEVVSQFIAQNTHRLTFAFFNPEMVQNSQAKPLMRVRMQHVVSSSNSRSKKLAAIRVGRKMYHATYQLCLRGVLQGPQHPCCDYAMYSRSAFRTDWLDAPPFLVGGTYGVLPPWNRSIRQQMTLPQHKYWARLCRVFTAAGIEEAFGMREPMKWT
eukprot:TRINITY_DN41650_c0_g1_i1.p1 TRINITY_DN41650_c0_g1~~TRINITY_DN41650_c0_g1_i1.p1  ORF type:complete len:502 (-),score=65.63 TRINITY_DN41650_c0_g1_i1:32-1537(-)